MLGILGDNLEKQILCNSRLCADVLKEESLFCYRSYCIGNTENQDTKELTIYVNDSYKKNQHHYFPSGRSVFLLKALLPDSIIRHSRKIRAAIAKEPCEDLLRMHIYLSVHENKLNEFFHDIHQNLLKKEEPRIKEINNISQYGEIKLICVPYVNQDKTFDMEYALKNIAQLNAKFVYNQQEKQESAEGITSIESSVSSFFSNLKINITKGYKKI